MQDVSWKAPADGVEALVAAAWLTGGERPGSAASCGCLQNLFQHHIAGTWLKGEQLRCQVGQPCADLETAERLEFLGDAVLHALVSEHLFHALSDADEGSLTKARQWLLGNAYLARRAATWTGETSVQLAHLKGGQSSKAQSQLGSRTATPLADLEFVAKNGGRDTLPKCLGDLYEAVVGRYFVVSGSLLNVWHRFRADFDVDVGALRELLDWSKVAETLAYRDEMLVDNLVPNVVGPTCRTDDALEGAREGTSSEDGQGTYVVRNRMDGTELTLSAVVSSESGGWLGQQTNLVAEHVSCTTQVVHLADVPHPKSSLERSTKEMSQVWEQLQLFMQKVVANGVCVDPVSTLHHAIQKHFRFTAGDASPLEFREAQVVGGFQGSIIVGGMQHNGSLGVNKKQARASAAWATIVEIAQLGAAASPATAHEGNSFPSELTGSQDPPSVPDLQCDVCEVCQALLFEAADKELHKAFDCHWCDCCSVKVSGSDNYRQHCVGRKHQRRALLCGQS